MESPDKTPYRYCQLTVDRKAKNTQWEEDVKVKVAQACPTLCDVMDYTVHGILQARILEW